MTRLVPAAGDWEDHKRLHVEGINASLKGKINSLDTVTLATSSATTVITNVFLSPDSVVHFDPTTANAATELYGATMYVLAANRGDGTWTITHANNANADRTFNYTILG